MKKSNNVLYSEILVKNSNGIETQKDKLNIFFSLNEAKSVIEIFKLLKDEELITKFEMKDGTEWKSKKAISDLKNSDCIQQRIQYRPFDIRFTNYTGKTNGIMARPRAGVMNHFLCKVNLGLCCMRQFASDNFSFSLITKFMIDNRTFYSNRGKVNLFPLYLYPESNEQQSIDEKQDRTPNLNMNIVQQIADKINLTFTPEKEETKNTFSPIDILDYIYAVLHSPTYRETYKEFLKIDFPRVPYPKNAENFWQLVKFGEELRTIHLLEKDLEGFGNLQGLAAYSKDGDNTVTRKIAKKDYELIDKQKQIGRIWINDKQYFDNIPQIAWEFYIGGYQPAQKWLKDRHNRTLSFDDILHYQKIIKALTETDRIMKEIDKIFHIQ